MLIVAKQDNVDNLYAIWNTVTDRFLGVNLSYDDCIKTVMEYKDCSCKDAKERADYPQPFDDIAKQIYWGFEPDYAEEEPDDIKNAVRLIVNHYKKDRDFRNAFITNVRSALNDCEYIDCPFCGELYENGVLKFIADRIMGMNK